MQQLFAVLNALPMALYARYGTDAHVAAVIRSCYTPFNKNICLKGVLE